MTELKTVDQVMQMVNKIAINAMNHSKYIPETHGKCALESQKIHDAIRAELEKWQKEIDRLRNDDVNSSELFQEKQIQLQHADEKIADLLVKNKDLRGEIDRLSKALKLQQEVSDKLAEQKAELQAEGESINKIHKFDMNNMFNTLNATHEMNKKKEMLLAENVVVLQAEIDRLKAEIKRLKGE